MAAPRKKSIKEEEEDGEKKIMSSKDTMSSFLKNNKDDHYNYEEDVDYKVSSGSLQLDIHLGGGFGPGLHRFVGSSEAGKSSSSIEVMRNFLKNVPNSKALYVKAEGRLSKEVKDRAGFKFITDPNEWELGTCFVFESNIYETVVDVMRSLVVKNEENIRYYFLLDSVDGLISKGDLDKTFEESNKVAGGAVIAANFMKRMSIALAKRGHMAIFISQVRADIKLDPYSKAPIRQTSATGGNALMHYANWILEFEARFKSDLILQNPADKTIHHQKNPIIGHWAKVTVKKSPNEKTNLTIPYPIRYGRKDGRSIWIEKELVDLMIAWEFVEKEGAWFQFSEEFVSMIKEAGFKDLTTRFHGEKKLFDFIESNEALTSFLASYFKKTIVEG